MIPLDGWPTPPDPTPPADPARGVLWLCFAIAVLLFATICFIEFSERFFRDEEQKRERALEESRKRIEAFHDALLEQLIDASPGGRKPWQERRK